MKFQRYTSVGKLVLWGGVAGCVSQWVAIFFNSLSLLRSSFLSECETTQVGRDISSCSPFGFNISWLSGAQPRPAPRPVRPVGVPRPPPWESHGPTQGPSIRTCCVQACNNRHEKVSRTSVGKFVWWSVPILIIFIFSCRSHLRSFGNKSGLYCFVI